MNQAIETVFLVGAGPGDPGLITVRGRQVLARAEVVIVDRLVAPPLYDSLAAGVEVHLRGERGALLTQGSINALLVEKARTGKRVVRLKGGDPFVFGRGGEEAAALHAAGIPFEVVPGVTAAVAAPAYAGIPLTHRGLAGAVALVTGHESDDKDDGLVDWDGLARGATTLVLYMSVKRLGPVLARLVAAGRSPSTPAAVIERGTTAAQRVVVGTIADLAERVRAANIQPPALTVVGEVVGLRAELSWFEARLARPRILLLSTEDRDRERALRSPDEDSSAAVETVWINPMTLRFSLAALGQKLTGLERYGEIALTSRHAVESLALALEAAGLDGRALAGKRLCALTATAEALRERLGLRADRVAVGGAVELARGILDGKSAHGAVLYPRAAGGREELPEALRAAGVDVDVVESYELTPRSDEVRRAIALHRAAPFAGIGFGSPRLVDVFLDEIDAQSEDASLAGVWLGAIGATTAAALERRGRRVDVIPAQPGFAPLVDALAKRIADGG